MNCEMAADEPMLNDIMGDHGLLSGSETVKSTGMSDEDQSKFWSQVQKAERGQGQTDQGQGRANRSGRKKPMLKPWSKRWRPWYQKMFKESAEARTFRVSLTGTGMSDQMVHFISSHSVWLEKAYGVLNNHRLRCHRGQRRFYGVSTTGWLRMQSKRFKSIAQTMKKKYLRVETTKWVSLRN